MNMEKESGRRGTPYADDALMVERDTTAEEVFDFVRRRVEEPIEMNGKVIWNFSSHEVDWESLERATERKLRRTHYVIPYQVTGVWSVIYLMLPEVLQKAEVLVYNTNECKYYAHKNLLRKMPNETVDEFRTSLANRLLKEGYLEK